MQYDFNLAANTGMSIDVAGKFFKYKSGNGVIRVRTSKGGVVDLLPGQGVWNSEFTSLTITDRSGLPNAGIVLAGDFDFHDDRISGTVDVVDGSRTRTDQNRAFVAYVNGAVAGGSGAYAHQQLYNPVGSGKNLVVERVIVSSPVANTIRINKGGAILAQPAPDQAQSKKLGGASGVGQGRYEPASQAIQGTTMYNIFCPANTPVTIQFTEPVLVPPGWGLNVVAGVVESSMPTNFEYYEEPI